MERARGVRRGRGVSTSDVPGWLVPAAAVLLSALTFSLMSGTYHSYYLAAMVPGVSAVFGAGAVALWRRRADVRATRLAAALVLASAALAAVYLSSTPGHLGWTVPLFAFGGLGAAALVVTARVRHRLGTLATAASLAVLLVGPLAWSEGVATTAHRGSSPHAGPGSAAPASVASSVDPGVVALLARSPSSFTWAAAAVSIREDAAQHQLASGAPVMGIGGYFGIGPSPALARFQDLVVHGRVHWFLLGKTTRNTAGAAIDAWGRNTFVPTQVGRAWLYDLTSPR